MLFEGGSEGADRGLSYTELDRGAQRVAACLSRFTRPGDRALLLFPPGADFIVSFLGCLYAGVVAVPAYPPGSRRGLARLASILGDCAPRCVLTTSSHQARLRGLTEPLGELQSLPWLASDEMEQQDLEAGWEPPALDADSLAFLQYTSGSTGDPKGVCVSHGNLLANEELIRSAFDLDEQAVIVGWLPLYHDMGLIGNVLQPLYLGARCVLFSPLDFLKRPVRWLETISRHRGTTSGGPSFAYELCVSKVSPEQVAGLDLSTWTVAFNGAEPVRGETMERFASAFASCGFSPDAFYPCYGLAEATLFVTGGKARSGWRSRRFEAQGLEQHRAVATGSRELGRDLVSCGFARRGQEVRIVDPQSRQGLPAGAIGEIWVAGPSLARGYWRRPEVNRETFEARLAGADLDFLRTGDLGTLVDGELFVTGRLKDLIILRGRNFYPQDLERVAEQAHPDLRAGCTAAFSLAVEGEERLVVVQEAERHLSAPAAEIVEAIRSAITEETQAPVWEVVLARPGAVPKTSSGKVRRSTCRQLYQEGALPVIARSAVAAGRPGAPEPALLSRSELLALPAPRRAEALTAYLAAMVGRSLGLAAPDVPRTTPLLSLGLDSLAVMELVERLEDGLAVPVDLRLLLEGAGLAEVAERLAAALVTGSPGSPGAATPGDSPTVGSHPSLLTPDQTALLLTQLASPESRAWNLALRARLEPEAGAEELPDLARAAAALAETLSQSAVFRLRYLVVEGEPLARLAAQEAIPVRLVPAEDWSDSQLEAALDAESRYGFDLAREPVVRASLFVRGPHRGVLSLVIHHLAADFHSLALLGADWENRLGGAVPAQADSGLASLERFAAERRLGLHGEGAERDLAYWRQRLLPAPPPLALPADRPRPSHRLGRGASVARPLAPGLLARVEAVARSRGISRSTVSFAATAALLLRLGASRDLVLGMPMSLRRGRAGSAGLGYRVNLLPLRVTLAPGEGAADFLASCHRAVVEGLEHGLYPFAALIERLGIERTPNRPPLVEHATSLVGGTGGDAAGLAAFQLGLPGGELALGSWLLGSLPHQASAAQFDLVLLTGEVRGELAASLELDADLFDRATGERWLGYFEVLLQGLLDHPEAPLEALNLLAPAERRQLLSVWAEGGSLPHEPLVPERVGTQTAEAADRIAVVEGDEAWSYGELEARALALAGWLTAQGLRREDRLAVLAGRSTAHVVGAWAAFEAGLAYLPIDPAYPPKRRRLMLEDGGARLLITSTATPEAGDDEAALPIPTWSFEAALAAAGPSSGARPPVVRATEPEGLAYVIFTSGSTGRPKGVAVPHRGLANLASWHRRVFAIEAGTRCSALAGPSFDAAVWETWPCLAAGATLELAPEAVRVDPPRLADWLAEREIEVAFLATPLAESWLRQGLAAGAPRLRVLLTGGDRLHAWRPAEAGFDLVNNYGPTESSVVATSGSVPLSSEAATAYPSLGRPLPGLAAVVLDPRGEPAPIGLLGELLVGGAGLARGYLGRPALTAERFVPDPRADAVAGARLYRTGDRARWTARGELEFAGRSDDQIQVRGHRVEPGEIEAVLELHPGVERAVVLPVAGTRPGADARLVAYLIPRHGEPEAADREALLTFLGERLPAYMLPADFLWLPALPLTANGKIDVQALPTPETAAPGEEQGTYEAPRSAEERLVAEAFGEVLDQPQVGREDDFFLLGGHSLLAFRVAHAIRQKSGRELPVTAVMGHPVVRELAARLAETPLPPACEVTAGPTLDGLAPASPNQRQMWLLDRLGVPPGVYSMPILLELDGRPDQARLVRAVSALVGRHEVLRTVLEQRDGGLEQRVLAASELPAGDFLRTLSLADLAPRQADERLPELVREELRTPFRLDREPGLRVRLFLLPKGRSALLLHLHHVAADGWSVPILLRDLSAFYQDPAAALPAPPRYRDYAGWITERLAKGELVASEAFWRQRLRGVAAGLDLPLDRPRPAEPTFEGLTLLRELPADGLDAFARERGTTPFAVLLASFHLWLSRLTGQAQTLVGVPVANRASSDHAELVGYLANTIALEGEVVEGESFEPLLADVHQGLLEALAHQELPFERVVERLRPHRAGTANPLFQVFFDVRDERWVPALGPFTTRVVDVDAGRAKFDLSLTVVRRREGWRAQLEVARDLFEKATAERWLEHWQVLLEGLLARPQRPLAEIDLLTEAETRQLLEVASGAGRRAHDRRPRTLDAWVEGAIERHAGEPAIEHGGEAMSYRELGRRSAAVAAALVRRGIGLEDRVGLLGDRTPDLLVALLGVVRAGAAYLPIDPSHPPERQRFLLEDSGARLLLVGEGSAPPPVEGLEVLPLEQALAETGRSSEVAGAPSAPPAESADRLRSLAYLIYTSGSTGRPKAVAIEHRSASALVAWSLATFSSAELSRVLAATSLGFDLSVFELFATWAAGGTVVLVENGLDLLREATAPARLSLVNTVPSVATELLRHGRLPAEMAVLNLAGEPLRGSLARPLLAARPGLRLLNLYGPSEDTTYSTECQVDLDGTAEPAIGRPLAGTTAYVVDPRLRLVPTGLPGQLLLGGVGLARGYLGRPGLTAERFLPDGFGTEPGGRLYRTGDLVRWQPDGQLQFLGRCDHQVKLRGLRVELEEIERIALEHPAVRAAVAVVARTGLGDESLRLFLVAAGDGDRLLSEVRELLASRLPGGVRPQAIDRLAELPRLTNGKPDRRALAALPLAEPEVGTDGDFVPATPSEALVGEVWSEILGLPVEALGSSFFELGGHSLSAVRAAGRLSDRFGLEVAATQLFHHPTVGQLATWLDGEIGGAPRPALPPVESQPLRAREEPSFAQERLWFLEGLEPGSPVYNMNAVATLSGALDVRALGRAAGAVVGRHAPLRSSFIEDEEGRPWVEVEPPPAARDLPRRLPVIDLGSLPAETGRAEGERLARAEAAVPFRLDAPPLHRLRLVRLGPAEHLLLATFHHAIFDGWSMRVLWQELAAAYARARNGAEAESSPLAPPAPLPVGYHDYARWQRGLWRDGLLEPALAGWRERLAGPAETLDLPTDRPRPPVRSAAGDLVGFEWGPEVAAQVESLARRSGVTRFMVLAGLFQALLGRLAGSRLVRLGCPVANRRRPELEGLIGLFVNTVVLPAELPPRLGVVEHLRRVRTSALAAFAGEDVPFEKVVEAVAPVRDRSRNPLFEVMLTHLAAPAEPPALAGLDVRLGSAHPGTTRLDLTLSLTEVGAGGAGGLSGAFELSTELFDRSTLERWSEHLRVLIEGAAAAPEAALDGLPLLTHAQRDQLRRWDPPAAAEPAAGAPTLDRLVAAQAERTPTAIAVRSQRGEAWSYQQLMLRAREIRAHLERSGIGPGDRVAVLLQREPTLVAALLGILECGAAYVPLDAAYPAERLAFMLADCEPRAVLVDEAGRQALPPTALPVLEVGALGAAPVPPGPSRADASLPAYVIYTSGSTGRPKGVVLGHHSAWHLLRWAADSFGAERLAATLASTSVCFDLSVFELFAPLSLGGTVVLVDNVLAWASDLEAAGPVTLVNTVPSAATELERLGALPESVRVLSLAGEPLRGSLVAKLQAGRPELEVWNLYGPTEDTTYSTAERIPPRGQEAEPTAPVPEPTIGLALPGTRARVLDPAGREAPLGVPGLLHLSGVGLAQGYFRRPSLTAERFRPDAGAAEPGERCYDTGDRALRRPDGRLVYLGRADHQVKLRGFRIELGEVEAAATAIPGVAQAAAAVLEQAGSPQLVLFVEARPGIELAASTVQERLARRLPAAMRPGFVHLVAALPLSPNGKVDRRALAGLAVTEARSAPPRPPRTPVELGLAEIFQELLATETLGLDDDFFALGGHSLLAAQAVSRIRRAFDLPGFSLAQLFTNPRLGELAREISRLRAEREEAPELARLLAEIEALSPEELDRLLAVEVPDESFT